MEEKEKRACAGSNCEIDELKRRLVFKDSVIESLIVANINLLKTYQNVQNYILKEDPLKELSSRE
ncbi:Uncharacterised protein [Enterococcus casseliflavus]|uniref:hypothetical protein n=1 Tax=Enterococcus TaxID=1350 RepID=UPI000E079241|nr:hypothetical protein [Enterococcus casseliflavus]GEB28475.1 hypothetical protein ECA02_15700 [Enterococcus casseliflavus]STP35143.1 Uncharacterised protein [Enterococcus casseliflavus]